MIICFYIYIYIDRYSCLKMNDPMQSSTQGFGVEGRAYILIVTCLSLRWMDAGDHSWEPASLWFSMSGLGQPDSQNDDAEAEVKLLNCQDSKGRDCRAGHVECHVTAGAAGWFQDGQILALSFSQGLADVKAIGRLGEICRLGRIGTDWNVTGCHVNHDVWSSWQLQSPGLFLEAWGKYHCGEDSKVVEQNGCSDSSAIECHFQWSHSCHSWRNLPTVPTTRAQFWKVLSTMPEPRCALSVWESFQKKSATARNSKY